MFVTNSIKSEIQSTLNIMLSHASILYELSNRPAGWSDDTLLQLAAERAFHVAVECATDVGNDIIDALVMRDAGGYGDIIKVLAEEGVVQQDWIRQFAPAIDFRQRLVRDYKTVSAGDVEDNVAACAALFAPYAEAIRSYLQLDNP
ncbi:DUF86 domain-containing protein [Alicyclobacillus sp. SO9]|uniref:DUF86 domain-containing protein n=1 Tax=Alicyclobacillus sp. SO9 TaxID=2665646 RepID=UPI0018E8A09D|nr:HepT-like ribonuclease domain-containing protein [Alicyclobacillus sp. SO9]QQE80385.1 DUF86 domain-containing protein [Alicyclobacillus sp. SO9]